MRPLPLLVHAVLVLGPLLAGSAHADVNRGAELHQESCVACHAGMSQGDDSAFYTRAERKITSLGGLERQVRRCKESLSLTWFDDEMGDVIQYLNQRYYKFTP